MARGWESKSIESQIESAESRREKGTPHLTTEQLAKQRERESLELTRRRVQHDLDTATHERYRESLRAALKHLDDKIAQLG